MPTTPSNTAGFPQVIGVASTDNNSTLSSDGTGLEVEVRADFVSGRQAGDFTAKAARFFTTRAVSRRARCQLRLAFRCLNYLMSFCLRERAILHQRSGNYFDQVPVIANVKYHVSCVR